MEVIFLILFLSLEVREVFLFIIIGQYPSMYTTYQPRVHEDIIQGNLSEVNTSRPRSEISP